MGERKITIDDIARELGCSKTTVSRAITGKGRISEGTKRRVWDYCLAQGYRIDDIRGMPKKNKTYNIGVILPADEELQELPFFHNCILGICEQARNRGYDIFLVLLEEHGIAGLERVVDAQKADGFIHLRMLKKDRVGKYLESKQIPFIGVGDGRESHWLYVDDDSEMACQDMTSYLLENNYQRIALIGGDMGDIVSKKRFNGFKSAFLIHHKKIHRELIYTDCCIKGKVYEAVEHIVNDCAECIVCMDDKICIQVLMKLQKMNISIPKDMKVVSFYDSIYLQSYSPSITAIRFDEKNLGKVVCEKMINRIEKGSDDSKVFTDYKIMIRKSTK